MIRIFTLLCCLAACSGGGGQVSGPPVPSETGFVALQDSVAQMGVSYMAALPTTGVADYRGMARLALPLGSAPALYHGDLRLSVDFGGGAAPMTGTIGGLQGPGAAVYGALQISGGRIYPDAHAARDYQFGADLTGNLTQAGQTHALSAEISGDFHGPGGTAVSGVIHRGKIGQADAVDMFHGAFAARQVASGG
ncbi:hypothetical protein [Yoonia sp.]|uniref:hypothetical protein n=1 Tax=Yoonia sp. TaxID=2212373 RepID=UPI00391D6B66